MSKIKLKNGYSIDSEQLNIDDYELFEDMVDAEKDSTKIPSVLRRFLGEEEYAKFKEASRDENGKITMKAMTDALQELFQEVGEVGKK